MYIHVYTFLQMYIHVCTWYVHGMYIPGYKRVCTSFRHVCTCLYYYVQFLNHTNMYIQCINLYIKCCVAHVQCTDGYIHFMKCTDIAEPGTYIDISFWIQLFDSPGRLACRQLGLAAAWRHWHAYSSSSIKFIRHQP
jgi:hypothetical protein